MEDYLLKGFGMKAPLRALFWSGVCSLVPAAPGMAGGDTTETGISIAMLTTEDSLHQSVKPARPEFAESCFLTWEETEQEREERKNGNQYKKSHYSFSLLKICYYDCLGSEVSMEVGARQLCPPTIR